jgi:hypothetical protein
VGRVAIRIERQAAALGAAGQRSMISVNRAVKAIASEEAAKVSGGDGRLTGKKRRGIKLRSYDEIDDGQRVTFGRVKGRPAAGWVWVNTGTRGHDIRRRKRGPLRKMTVHHPGTRGRGAWRKVRTRAERVIPQIFRDEIREALR